MVTTLIRSSVSVGRYAKFSLRQLRTSCLFSKTRYANVAAARSRICQTRSDVAALASAGDDLFTPIIGEAGDRYRLCANATQYRVCNWAIPADDSMPLCVSLPIEFRHPKI